MWLEIREFLLFGNYPARCTTDREKLSYLKRSRRYLYHQERLWLAPKKGSVFLPRLIIEDLEKRGSLMAQAHNDCGHKGRDAVYAQLRDRFYWPNMYSDVSYFVRSCLECQM
ncbi:hypothetical protein B0H12DRAFT_1026005, partial [Mycena haematopus]